LRFLRYQTRKEPRPLNLYWGSPQRSMTVTDSRNTCHLARRRSGLIGSVNRLPTIAAGVQRRLKELLDRQDGGQALTAAERREAEGLVELAEMLSLLKLRASKPGPVAA